MFLVFLCLWDYVTGSKLHYGVPVVESSLNWLKGLGLHSWYILSFLLLRSISHIYGSERSLLICSTRIYICSTIFTVWVDLECNVIRTLSHLRSSTVTYAIWVQEYYLPISKTK